MPEILPSLFDRLLSQDSFDDDIEAKVKRDLGILLNSRGLSSLYVKSDGSSLSNLDKEFPESSKSVINYGLEDYSGLLRNEYNIRVVVKMLRETILTFEPRIIPNTLRILPDEDMKPDELRSKLHKKGALEFTIRGSICTNSVPIDFQCSTELSFASGKVRVT